MAIALSHSPSEINSGSVAWSMADPRIGRKTAYSSPSNTPLREGVLLAVGVSAGPHVREMRVRHMIVSRIHMYCIGRPREIDNVLGGQGVWGAGTCKIVGYRVKSIMVRLGDRRQVLEYPGPVLPICSAF